MYFMVSLDLTLGISSDSLARWFGTAVYSYIKNGTFSYYTWIAKWPLFHVADKFTIQNIPKSFLCFYIGTQSFKHIRHWSVCTLEPINNVIPPCSFWSSIHRFCILYRSVLPLLIINPSTRCDKKLIRFIRLILFEIRLGASVKNVFLKCLLPNFIDKDLELWVMFNLPICFLD